jgi:hypothetical protein
MESRIQHSDVEELLRRYRPIGPPPDLRTRILSTPSIRHLWLWAAAAAMVIITIVSLHHVTDQLTRQMNVGLWREPATRAVEDIADILGRDPGTQLFAEFIVLYDEEQREAELSPSAAETALSAGEER